MEREETGEEGIWVLVVFPENTRIVGIRIKLMSVYYKFNSPPMHPHDAQTPLCATTCFTVGHLGSSDVRQSCEVDGEVEDSALGSDSLLDVLRFVIGNQTKVRVDVGEERLEVELRVEHDFVCDQTARKDTRISLSFFSRNGTVILFSPRQDLVVAKLKVAVFLFPDRILQLILVKVQYFLDAGQVWSQRHQLREICRCTEQNPENLKSRDSSTAMTLAEWTYS